MKKIEVSYEISLEIKKSTDIQIEILRDVLGSFGIKQESIIELKQNEDSFLSVYVSSLKEANRIKRNIAKSNLKGVTVHSKSLREKDWQSLWKKDFKPFKITKNFYIIPIWLKKDTDKRKKESIIYMDTNVAFGTGMHATTRYMAQFVDRCSGKFNSFFDIGTGTGILAMIAAKGGAADVSGIDISQDAINVAEENLKRNKCPSVNLSVADFNKLTSKKKFDFVAANLITQDLIDSAKKLLSFVGKNKYLAVSGISLNNYPLFRKTFDKLPLRCLKIEKGEGWVALLYKKLT